MYPQRTTLPRYFNLQLILVNVTLYPALYSFTMEMSKHKARPKPMLAIHAFEGSSGIANLHLCVNQTLAPSGIMTVMGLIANTISVADTTVTRKLLVTHELRLVQSLMLSYLK